MASLSLAMLAVSCAPARQAPVLPGSDGPLEPDRVEGASWTRAATQVAWPNRDGHATVVFKDRLWVIGGWGLSGPKEGNLNDVWSSTDGKTWRPATGQAQWLPRNGHTSVVFQKKMWVIGGWSHFIGGTSVNDLWSSGG